MNNFTINDKNPALTNAVGTLNKLAAEMTNLLANDGDMAKVSQIHARIKMLKELIADLSEIEGVGGNNPSTGAARNDIEVSHAGSVNGIGIVAGNGGVASQGQHQDQFGSTVNSGPVFGNSIMNHGLSLVFDDTINHGGPSYNRDEFGMEPDHDGGLSYYREEFGLEFDQLATNMSTINIDGVGYGNQNGIDLNIGNGSVVEQIYWNNETFPHAQVSESEYMPDYSEKMAMAQKEAYKTRTPTYPVDNSIWAVDQDVLGDVSLMHLDVDHYPLAPDGNVTFVRTCVSDETNPNLFHKVSRWQWDTVKVLGSDNIVRYWRKHCRGVLVCSSPTCRFARRPIQNLAPLKKFLDDASDEKWICNVCGSRIKYVSCSAVIVFAKNRDAMLMQHFGLHGHIVPPNYKPDQYALRKLEEVIVAAPKSKPMQLVAGSRIERRKSVGTIDPIFVNKDMVAYHQKKIFKKRGVQLGKDMRRGIEVLVEEFEASLHGHSLLPGESFITLSCPFMNQLLLDVSRVKQDGGVLSDVTYSLFKEGYLLSSVVYSTVLKRWIPVMISWMDNLSSPTMRHHFVALFKIIRDNISDSQMQSSLVASAMDFSAAQDDAFISGYVEVFGGEEQDARKLLGGCIEHFRQSVVRIKRNHAIIDPLQETQFTALANNLITCEDVGEFAECINRIELAFPRASAWLSWWVNGSAGPKIFKAMSTMDDSIRSNLRRDTNPQESWHNLLYSVGGRHFEVCDGLVQVFDIVKHWEILHQAALHGTRVRHGVPEPWKLSKAKYGSTKKSRMIKSDGVAPTSTKELVKGPGRKKGSRNVVKTPQIAYESYTSDDADLSLDLCWMEILFQLYTANGLDLKPIGGEDIPVTVSKAFEELQKRKQSVTQKSLKGRFTRTKTWLQGLNEKIYPQIVSHAQPFGVGDLVVRQGSSITCFATMIEVKDSDFAVQGDGVGDVVQELGDIIHRVVDDVGGSSFVLISLSDVSVEYRRRLRYSQFQFRGCDCRVVAKVHCKDGNKYDVLLNVDRQGNGTSGYYAYDPMNNSGYARLQPNAEDSIKKCNEECETVIIQLRETE
jgi:hypothetical protein